MFLGVGKNKHSFRDNSEKQALPGLVIIFETEKVDD